MNTLQILTASDKTIRTQITLTNNLKKLIEEKARLKGQSLSEYLRLAAMVSLLLEEEEKSDRKKLANMVIGSVDMKKHPYWNSPRKIRQWVKNLRKEWK